MHCAFRKHDLFASVDVFKYKDLLQRVIQLRYCKKSILFVEYSPAVELFVVRKGLVKIEETLDDGSKRIIQLIKKGGVVGLETFLNKGQRYDHTAIALQETEVCRISYLVLKGILESDPDFYKAVLKEWHDQIENLGKGIIEFSTGKVQERVARVLLLLIGEAKFDSQTKIEMIPADDTAAITGTTRESISRTIADFKRNKLLTKSRPKYMYFDEIAIRNIVEGNE